MTSLVRRLPWSSPNEFLCLFDLLFSPSNLDSTTTIALTHLHAWSLRAPSALPPAIHSTHALLSLLVLPSPSHPPGPARRLALAMALTRLVNSLVDPLQTSMFARSIAELARQLELPPSLVQLRHRSTHEDLPSEQLLLDSARLALDWLYTRYWYPTMIQLTSALSTQPASADPRLMDLESLRAILKDYKQARKRELIDATQSLPPRQLAQKLERWLEQRAARVLSNPTLEGPGEAGEEVEEVERERRAVESFAEEIAGLGSLVPRAIKKRPQKLHARLPLALRELYQPLLLNLSKVFPQTLLPTLLDQLVAILISAPAEPAPLPKADDTFYICIAAWMVEFLPMLERQGAEDLLKCLLAHPNRYCLSVCKMLEGSLRIEGLECLLSVRQEVLNQPAFELENPDEELKQRFARWDAIRSNLNCDDESDTEMEQENLGRWMLVDRSDWSGCPIGMLPGGVLPHLLNLP